MMPLHAGKSLAPKRGAAIDAPAPWFEPRLRALSDALVVESAGRFRFADLPPFDLDSPNAMLGSAAPPKAGLAASAFAGFGTNPLVETMCVVLYNFCYARELNGGVARLPTGHVDFADPVFLAELRAANHGRARWDPGWVVRQIEPNGAARLEKAGVRRLAKAGDYATPMGQSRSLSPGDMVSHQLATELLDAQPGFYFAIGETVPDEDDDGHLGRLYFHVPPEHVPWLLGRLTRDLNRYRVPYRIKCLTNPVLYDRSDPMVLYMAKRFLSITLRVLQGLRGDLEERLLPGVPLCSKPLLAGLGAADEPGNAKSFGQTRSYILAQAMIDAWEAGDSSYERRRELVSHRFRQLGLSQAHPHLSEGSVDRYEWPASAEVM